MKEEEKKLYEVNIKKVYRLYLVGKLAKYFSISKEDLLRDNNLEVDEIMDFNSIPDFNHIMYPVHMQHANFTLVCGSKFVKTDLYARFLDAENRINESLQPDFALVTHLKTPLSEQGEFWVLTRRDRTDVPEYGGVCVVAEETGEYFMYEPLDNFLRSHYPISSEFD